MFLFFTLLSFFASVNGLECYINQTHTEECPTSWFNAFFTKQCFNRTELLEDGRTSYTYGCGSNLMQTLPNHPSYCHKPEGFLLGYGTLCLCNTDRCNHQRAYHFDQLNAGSVSTTIPLITALPFFFFLA